MIALAVLFFLVVAAVTVVMAVTGYGGDHPLTFHTFAGTISTNPFWVFLLGAASMLVAVWGFSLLRRGTRRRMARRREMKRLRRVEEEAAAAGATTSPTSAATPAAGTTSTTTGTRTDGDTAGPAPTGTRPVDVTDRDEVGTTTEGRRTGA